MRGGYRNISGLWEQHQCKSDNEATQTFDLSAGELQGVVRTVVRSRVHASPKGRSSYLDLAHCSCAKTWAQVFDFKGKAMNLGQYLLIFKIL